MSEYKSKEYYEFGNRKRHRDDYPRKSSDEEKNRHHKHSDRDYKHYKVNFIKF
jgi:hypothetical protein